MAPIKSFSYSCVILCALCVVLTVGSSIGKADLSVTGPDYDLTASNATGEVTVNGAIFQNALVRSTGTGLIKSFLVTGRVGDVGEGYNTEGTLEFQTKSQSENLLLGAVPIVNDLGDGIDYREFGLDINQIQSGDAALLSLEQVEIYLSDAESGVDLVSYATLGTIGTKVWELDAGTHGAAARIIMDSSLSSSGSGAGDAFVYIPDDLFEDGAGGYLGEYVYLYTKFGSADYPANDGFEEWWVLEGGSPTVVPVPGALVLGGMGLSVAGYALKRRKAHS